MVKQCSPFGSSGVVDSSFKWAGASSGQLPQTAKAADVRSCQVCSLTAACPTSCLTAPYFALVIHFDASSSRPQASGLTFFEDEPLFPCKKHPSSSIKNFYHILSHLPHEFFSKSPQTRKDIIRKLIEEVKVNVISPHLYTLNITWISPVSCGREDVALFWRSDPISDENLSEWTEDEEAALHRLYPNSPKIELMKAMPYKTPGMIKSRASTLGIKRDRYHIVDEQERFYWTVCYADLQVAAEFTQTIEERSYLWGVINNMAENTKRGQLTASWFLPVDAVSFERALCVTDVKNSGALPGYR